MRRFIPTFPSRRPRSHPKESCLAPHRRVTAPGPAGRWQNRWRLRRLSTGCSLGPLAVRRSGGDIGRRMTISAARPLNPMFKSLSLRRGLSCRRSRRRLRGADPHPGRSPVPPLLAGRELISQARKSRIVSPSRQPWQAAGGAGPARCYKSRRAKPRSGGPRRSLLRNRPRGVPS
jgi:hypothetical protein